jgi:uridine monophosphate synthetase
LAAVPYAALTIGTAIALVIDKPLIYPRKEIKSYGTGRGIEGVFEVGETAVIIEDLVTSGGSVVKAAIPLVEAGLHLRDVVVLIDREQGGRENLVEQGYQLHAVLRLSEILDTLYQAGRISATELAAVKAQE